MASRPVIVSVGLGVGLAAAGDGCDGWLVQLISSAKNRTINKNCKRTFIRRDPVSRSQMHDYRYNGTYCISGIADEMCEYKAGLASDQA
jgi:hypothetical protein